MKFIGRNTLSVLMVLISISAFSQDSSNTYSSSPLFPKAGDVGVSLVFDGLLDNLSLGSVTNEIGQNILFVKYYLEDDLVLRLGFGVSVNSYKRSTADSIGVSLVETDSSFSNYLINISGGIEKHLRPTKRLDPFIFSQLDITFIGKTNGEINSRQTSTAGTNKINRTIKQDGGIGIGLQIGGGLNYFVAQRFSIGTELALRLLYVKEGGTISDNTIFTSSNGVTTSDFNTREDQINLIDLGVQPNAQLNISYFF